MRYTLEDNDRICRNISLSIAQRDRLFTALMATDTMDYQSDLLLARIVRGVNDEALLTFMKSRLPRVRDQYLWQTTGIMHEIVDLTGSKELGDLLTEFSKEVFAFAPENKSKAILSGFISKMQAAGLKKAVTAAGRDFSAL